MLISRKITPRFIHLMKVRNYPAVPLKEKQQLPGKPGVYYCVRGWEILYVGKAKNMNTRWNSYQFGEHHKYEELRELEESIGDVDIHYSLIPDWMIGFEEALEIDRFKPRMNKRRESIWENLNFQVIKLLAVRSIVEFILLACLGMLIVTLIRVLF